MAIFLIYSHIDPEMTARLCAALYPNRIFLHVDLKSDIKPFEEELEKVHSEHVTFTDRRVRVNWAGFSQVRAMCILVEEALKVSQPEEHLVMLSGQDYPIRPIPEFLELLTLNAGVQFIRSFEILESSQHYVDQISRRHYRDLRIEFGGSPILKRIRNGVIRAFDRFSPLSMPNVPDGFRIMHGQTHWVLTAECAAEVLRSATPEIDKFFRFCFASDEKYFHTLVANGSFGNETRGNGVVSFEGPGNWRYSNFHHIHPTLKKTYMIDEWDIVVESDKFFIRKVESAKSAELLNRIDRDLL